MLLWASSLIGGAIENWAVYRGLPQAIADHPLGDRIGVDRMRRLGRFVERNLSGWGVNVSLGFLLGMTPAFGSFLGLPLEVRHVTLTTGMLALALAALPGGGLHDPRLGMPLLGIAVIFVLNLGVSFGLALAVALRARDVQSADKRAFLRALLVRMLHSPLEFVLPPRANGSREPPLGDVTRPCPACSRAVTLVDSVPRRATLSSRAARSRLRSDPIELERHLEHLAGEGERNLVVLVVHGRAGCPRVEGLVDRR